MRWDKNHPGRLLVSSPQKDPGEEESKRQRVRPSSYGTLEAIRRCLKATESVATTRKLDLKGRRADTPEVKYATDRIRNALYDLVSLNLREDTEKRSEDALQSNDKYMSFWIIFPPSAAERKRDCLAFIEKEWEQHLLCLKGEEVQGDGLLIESLKQAEDSTTTINQWVDERLDDWKEKFLSIYKRFQLSYVPLELYLSTQEDYPDNLQSDYVTFDISSFINSTLSTTTPCMILVEGEAGSGKTSLLIQIAISYMEQRILPILLEPHEDSSQDIVEVVRNQLKFAYPDVNVNRVQELLRARRLIIFIDQYSLLTPAQKNWCKKQLHPDKLDFFVLSSRLDPSSDFKYWTYRKIRTARLRSEGYSYFFSQLLNYITFDKSNTFAEKHSIILANQLKLIAPLESTVLFAFLALCLYISTNLGPENFEKPKYLDYKIFPSIQSWEELSDEYVLRTTSYPQQDHESFQTDFLHHLKLLAITVLEQSDKYYLQPFNKDTLKSAFDNLSIFNDEAEKVLINSTLISMKSSSKYYEFSFSSLAILMASLGLIQRTQNTKDSCSEVYKFINDFTAQSSIIRPNIYFLASLRFCCLSMAKEHDRWHDNVKLLDNYLSAISSHSQIPGTSGDIRHNLDNHKKYRKFIGRESYLEKLIKKLCDPEQPDRIIKIKGVGGAGKTALAIESALRICTRYPNKFTVIYCQSAKVENRGSIGSHVNDPGEKFTSLDSLIAGILSFCYSDSRMFSPIESKRRLIDYLESTNNSTLIILDSFEALEISEQHRIQSFFDDLNGSQYKLMLTTRVADYAAIDIEGLSQVEAAQMIEEITNDNERKSVLILDEKDKEEIFKAAKLLPLAIVFIIGELQRGQSLDYVIKESQNPSGELCEHLFGRSFQDIQKNYPACLRLLYALSFAPDSFKKENLFQIAKVPLPIVPNSGDQIADEDTIEDEQLQEGLRALDRWSWVVARERLGITGTWYSFRSSLIRDYILKALSDSHYHDSFREAWVNCYVDKANEHGNVDFGEWHQQFDHISDDWSNYEAVFGWCRDNWSNSLILYRQAKLLWKSLSRFLYLYPHFEIRNDWSKWLEDRSQKMVVDESFFPELYMSIAWLALMKDGDDDRERALSYLDKARVQLNDNLPDQVNVDYLIIRAVLETRNEEFAKASQLFQKANEVCDSLLALHPQDNERCLLLRAKVRLNLYSGEKFYREGDYRTARELYTATFSEAENIGWLRFQIKASERLAYLDIREGRLREAENRLMKWEERAENNKDKRRLAFFHRDFAELYLQQEKFDMAIERATQAKEEFKKLSMKRRECQMEEMLKKIALCRDNRRLLQI